MQKRTPTGELKHPVILFDGVCNLCNRSVQFVIRHDPKHQFRFATLQSAVARELLKAREWKGAPLESILLIEGERVYQKSSAALRIARRLHFPFNLLFAFIVVPPPVRDALYSFVAKRRYRWFGMRAVCMLPTPEIEKLFLD